MWQECQNFLWLSQSTTCKHHNFKTFSSISLNCRRERNQHWWTRAYWVKNEKTKPSKKHVCSAVWPQSTFLLAALQRKALNWSTTMPLNRWGKRYLQRLRFEGMVKRPHQENQWEHLQGCRLGAVPIKLDGAHSSLTALGGNGSISTSFRVTFLLCQIYICKCLKSSHLPGVLWLCYNCQSKRKLPSVWLLFLQGAVQKLCHLNHRTKTLWRKTNAAFFFP